MFRPTPPLHRQVRTLLDMEDGPRVLESWMRWLMIVPLVVMVCIAANEVGRIWDGVSNVVAQATTKAVSGAR